MTECLTSGDSGNKLIQVVSVAVIVVNEDCLCNALLLVGSLSSQIS